MIFGFGTSLAGNVLSVPAADAGVVAWAVAATPAVALALVAHQAGPLFAHMKETP